MDCERFDKNTMELLYGELDELSEATALRHLHHCTRCRDIWAHLRTTRDLADLPKEEPPPDLFELILETERIAHNSLTVRERFSRAISVMAGYAMRPQLAMAALLLLVIGSSLVFIRASPTDRGQVSVTELGRPSTDQASGLPKRSGALVFGREPEDATRDGRSDINSPTIEQREAQGDSSAQAPASTPDDTGSRRAYSEAMAAYQDGRYAEAERLFSEIASSSSSQSASAALHEGHAARNGSGCQRAAGLYDAIATKYTGGTVANEASWHAASCYRAMGQLERAAAHYSRLKERTAYASRADKALKALSSQSNVASAPGVNAPVATKRGRAAPAEKPESNKTPSITPDGARQVSQSPSHQNSKSKAPKNSKAPGMPDSANSGQ